MGKGVCLYIGGVSPLQIIHIPLTAFLPPAHHYCYCLCVWYLSLIFHAVCLGGSLNLCKNLCVCLSGWSVSVVWNRCLCLLSHNLNFNLTLRVPAGRSPPGITQSEDPHSVEIKSSPLNCKVIRDDPSYTQALTHKHTLRWSCWTYCSAAKSECV